ncbi:hypothetical protein TNCV_1439951 [Trichonephila clavipes]|nr:hypothetical protein TNCV_1439951 [Trichonephila clavipes]
MGDPIYYELKAIAIAAGTSRKCNSPKSFPSFKVSLELSFSIIMFDHTLQRLFETSVQPTHAISSLACLIAGYVAYSTCVRFGWSASRS